jgi:hydroxybutyrate-dimer hydrolase
MDRSLNSAAALAALLILTACGSGGGDGGGTAALPQAPAPTPAPSPAPAPAGIAVARYDGVTNDLLTAGLGWDGLAGAAPSLSSPPTPEELRRLAIYTNYRALVDIQGGGGYGRLYGPNVAANGTVSTAAGAGKIAGSEHITQVAGPGFAAATLMVQIPTSFSPTSACIVTATSSGSRGIYGAISAAGEWGLKRGCAVAYTDKGTGSGAHELATNTVTLMNGQTAAAPTAGAASQFTANLTDAERTAYLQSHPHRYAFKHAHSQQNPEKDWGRYTLQAIEFAFARLAAEYPGTTFNAANTLVIADAVSNGGGASLAAAEQDVNGLIDGVVVGEPEVNPRMPAAGINIQRGATVYPATAVGRPLYDYMTLANLLQPCAAFAATATDSPLRALLPSQNVQNRCAALAAAGYISGADLQTQANNALAQLRAAGWEPESDLLHASHWWLRATPGVAVTYANAYARANVNENLCDFSFATVGALAEPVAAATSPMATIFGVGNGVPPTGNPAIDIVYNTSQAGPVTHWVANGDFGYAGAHCLRQLWTTQSANALRVQQGVDEVKLTGNLRGKPAIILHGRADALVPVNHTSRPYFGLNKLNDSASKLSYIEVLNAQHFDAFLGLGGYNTAFVPLHYYTQQALDLMWNHLRGGAQLPPSQVVRPVPRAAVPADLTTANLPAISLTPAAGNAITFDSGSRTVQIPD